MIKRLMHTRLVDWMRKHPFLGGVVCAGVTLVVIMILGVTVAPMMPTFMSEAVAIQAIASGAVVASSVAPALLSTNRIAASAAADAKVVREEVKNNHRTNFREDTDLHRDQILDAIKQLRTETATSIRELRTEVRDDIDGLRKDIRGLRTDGGRQDDRIGDLEDAVFKGKHAAGAADRSMA